VRALGEQARVTLDLVARCVVKFGHQLALAPAFGAVLVEAERSSIVSRAVLGP
jgi:hypothetical protein